MITDINIREFLSSVAEWLSWQEEDITYGLKTPEDAIKLYRYALENEDLPEMADTWAYKDRRRAIGYDPLINAKTKYAREQDKHYGQNYKAIWTNTTE